MLFNNTKTCVNPTIPTQRGLSAVAFRFVLLPYCSLGGKATGSDQTSGFLETAAHFWGAYIPDLQPCLKKSRQSPVHSLDHKGSTGNSLLLNRRRRGRLLVGDSGKGGPVRGVQRLILVLASVLSKILQFIGLKEARCGQERCRRAWLESGAAAVPK